MRLLLLMSLSRLRALLLILVINSGTIAMAEDIALASGRRGGGRGNRFQTRGSFAMANRAGNDGDRPCPT